MPLTNTLENARRLEALGFTHQQAQGVADLLEVTARDAQPDLSRLATKTDLKDMELGLTLRFGAMLAAAVAIVVALVKLL